MKKVLLTGFEPFGGEAINPSWEVVKRLEKTTDQYQILAKQLPCVFDRSLDYLYRFIEDINPDIVICVGQAGGRAEICIERIAINLNDATIPDNQGNQPIDTPVITQAPHAYFSTLPNKAMVNKMREAGIPTSLSLSAGSYVCNHTMFGLLHYLHLTQRSCLAGFIHIPYLPEQGVFHRNMPTMSLEILMKGIDIAIQTALSTERDIHIPLGAVC